MEFATALGDVIKKITSNVDPDKNDGVSGGARRSRKRIC